MLFAQSAFNSVWNVLLFILWIFLFAAVLMLIFQVLGDIFRRRISGGKKALWTIAVIIFPLIGSLVYLIINGDGMAERQVKSAEASEAMTRAYIRDAAGTGGPADQLSALKKMYDAGDLSDDEYAKAKAKILA